MGTYNPGDKVVHASGHGPEMVVRAAFLGADGAGGTVETCDCEYWNSKADKFVIERFPETSLKASLADDDIPY